MSLLSGSFLLFVPFSFPPFLSFLSFLFFLPFFFTATLQSRPCDMNQTIHAKLQTAMNSASSRTFHARLRDRNGRLVGGSKMRRAQTCKIERKRNATLSVSNKNYIHIYIQYMKKEIQLVLVLKWSSDKGE